MSSGRSAKRARKKERRQSRREEIRRYMQRRRRQRLGVLLGSVLVMGLGVVIAFVAFRSPDEEPPVDEEPVADTVVAPVREPVACGAELPEVAGSQKTMFADPEDVGLDPADTYILRLVTSCGDVAIELDLENSPQTANSIAFLAREGFFDGLLFHRIAPSISVVQSGDPRGDGTGGSGYQIVEPPPGDTRYTQGTVAMAKAGADPPGASGSQFFIVYGDQAEGLPPEYAVVGRVVEGMETLQRIAELGREDEVPAEWVYIERASVNRQVGER